MGTSDTHRAIDMPRLAVVVVLPTPPLPDVTTITRASAASPPSSPSLNATGLRDCHGEGGCVETGPAARQEQHHAT
jgi:hypothetical protein